MTKDYWGKAGAGVLFRAKDTGRYLFMHRSQHVNEPGTWATAGGKIEQGEEPREAAKREAVEETGYTGPIKLEPSHVYRDGVFTFHNFIGHVPHEFEPEHSWESQGHVWAYLDEPPSPLHYGLKELLSHISESKYWTGPKFEASGKIPDYKPVGPFVSSGKFYEILVSKIVGSLTRDTLSAPRLERIKELVRTGAFDWRKFPVQLVKDGSSYWIWGDGNHRVAAARELGKETIYAEIFEKENEENHENKEDFDYEFTNWIGKKKQQASESVEELDRWLEDLQGIDSTKRLTQSAKSDIVEDVWSPKNFLINQNLRSLKTVCETRSHTKSGSLGSSGMTITEDSLPPFSKILICSVDLQAELKNHWRHPTDNQKKETEAFLSWVESPKKENIKQRKPWTKNTGRVRLRIGQNTLRVVFNAAIYGNVLFLYEFTVFDDHDYAAADQRLDQYLESDDPKYDASVKGAFDMLTKQKAWIPEDLNLDLEKSRKEIKGKTEHDIEKESAEKWTGLAIAAFEMAAAEPSQDKKCELISWADDLYHEALEHAALIKDEGKTVGEVQREIEKVKRLAQDTKVSKMEDIERDRMFSLIEAVDPNDAIVHYPVTIRGEEETKEGGPYHITLRWGKWNGTKDELIQSVETAIEGLDTHRPKISTWRPEIFGGKEGKQKFYVLLVPVEGHMKQLRDALSSVFGEDPFPEYKPHITVDEDLWQEISKKKLSPGDVELDVLPLEVRMGNAQLEVLGEAMYKGKRVKLNKPMKGDVKKYKVYVKDPDTGNIRKVNFGDPNMKIKRHDPKRRKAFRARHGCDKAKDKTTAKYWSCRLWSKKPVSKILKGEQTEVKKPLTEDLAEWNTGEWVHYSNFPEMKINPKQGHQDPSGIYLFPVNFKPEGGWHTYKYKFSVQANVSSTLDMAHLTKEEAINLYRSMVPESFHETGIKEIEKASDPVDATWEMMKNYFVLSNEAPGKGAWNKAFRDQGFDSIFDDTGSIFTNEVQLLVLDPRKVKVIERSEQFETGFEEVKEVTEKLVEMLKPYGEVTVKGPTKQKPVWGGSPEIESRVEVKSGEKYLSFSVATSRFQKSDAVPREIRVSLSGGAYELRQQGSVSEFFDWKKKPWNYSDLQKMVDRVAKVEFKTEAMGSLMLKGREKGYRKLHNLPH